MDLEKYRVLFVEESIEHLAEMSNALAELERRESGDPEQAVDCLFRMAHSIKGMASSLEYDSVATLAHELEDWLEPCRSAGVLPDEALPILYEVVGFLESMIAQVAETGSPPELRHDIRQMIAQPLQLEAAPASNPHQSEPGPEAGSASKKARWPRRRACRAPSASAPRRLTASLRLLVN